MRCPDCERLLPDVATACRCGWITPAARAKPAFTCQHCSEMARMRIHVDSDWQNVCEAHYVEHFQQEAARSCEAIGLIRKPGESVHAYHLRVSAWLRDKAGRSVLKRWAE